MSKEILGWVAATLPLGAWLFCSFMAVKYACDLKKAIKELTNNKDKQLWL